MAKRPTFQKSVSPELDSRLDSYHRSNSNGTEKEILKQITKPEVVSQLKKVAADQGAQQNAKYATNNFNINININKNMNYMTDAKEAAQQASQINVARP